MKRRHVASLGVMLAACASAPSSDEPGCPARVQSALTLKCGPAPPLQPVTDPENPDFGRIPCRFFAAGDPGSGFCGCDTGGYAPLDDYDTATAKAQLTAVGACENSCCAELCFCELLQHAGEALARCQSGDPVPTLERAGFCYVEPDIGVGDPSTVAGCKQDERHRVLVTPATGPVFGTLVCETTGS